MRPALAKLPVRILLATLLSLAGCELPGKGEDARPIVLHLSLDDSLVRFDSVHVALTHPADPGNELENVWKGPLPDPTKIPAHTLTVATDPFLVKVLGFRKVYGFNSREQLAMSTHIIYEHGSKRVVYQAVPVQVPFNRLARLTPSEGTLEPPFNLDVSTYQLSLPRGVSVVSFDVLSEYTRAIIAVGGQPARAGSPRLFAVGDKDTTVAITVFDQEQTRTYTVKVIPVKPPPVVLDSLWYSIGTLTPAFHPDTLAFLLVIPSAASSVDIKLWPADPANQSAFFAGQNVFPGQANTVRLNAPGDTTLKTMAVSKDTSRRDYTIRIGRAK